jgi:hypothetical protein
LAWLEVGSVKMALSRPTHQRVTQAVRRLYVNKRRKLIMDQDKIITNNESSPAKRSRNLGIVAMAMMIGITIYGIYATIDLPGWAFAVFVFALLAALVLSIIGFVRGIKALREKNNRLTAILGLVLNSVAFLPSAFFIGALIVSKG